MDNTKRPWSRSLLAGLAIVVLGGLVAVSVSLLAPAQGDSETESEKHEPASVEHVDGSDLARIILTAKAAERLDIQTAPTVDSTRGRARLMIPYASLLYDAEGGTWAYTSPEPLTFVRAKVSVETIDGDDVYLTDGPAVGTPVVVVGAAELYGTEYGVGH